MTFADIKALVEEKLDGRTFDITKHKRWADTVRKRVARDALTGGFHGLHFLYKEATVKGGSVLNQARYAVPDDFVDDLNVFYDGDLLAKAVRGILDITVGDLSSVTDAGAPAWVEMAGQEFNLVPPPPEAGKEIKLFYNGLPAAITAGEAFTDYFLNHYPDLHVFGMAEHAAQYLGAVQTATLYRNLFQDEVKRLMLANRRWYLKNARIRFQNWEEFKDRKTLVFPQFGL